MTMTLAPSWQAVGAGTSGGGSAELDEDAGSEVAWAWLHLLETDLRVHDLEVLELKVDEYPYGLALESHRGRWGSEGRRYASQTTRGRCAWGSSEGTESDKRARGLPRSL